MTDSTTARVAALFDLDGVVLRATCGESLVRELIRHRPPGSRKLAAIVAGSALYWAGVRIPFSTCQIVGRVLAGLSVLEVEEITSVLADRLLAKVANPNVMQGLRRHSEMGHLTVLATGAPAPIAEAIGARLGMKWTLSTAFGVERGHYTGKLAGPPMVGRAKLECLESWARAECIDLGAAYMYANDFADRFLLESVGEPRIVNPEPRLARMAKDRGWTEHGRFASRLM